MSKRRDKAEWQQLIDEQAASGQTQKAFCEQVGISVATFGYWQRKLRVEALSTSTGSGTGTDPVSLSDWIELPTRGREIGGSWQIELDLGNGLCLRLRQG
ncbi:MAG TPA: IS66 family insertion sequence hypothetical protein [Gammaproteobacteria bacterium]|nr:IS66 family insertion sequence hypothetical protein [Gammaproteobacteria bacterium]